MAQKTDVVRARIESKVKKDAEAILKRIGVSHSTFISMSYRAVIAEKGLPLSLHIPNAETRRVLRDARNPKSREKYTSMTFDEFKKMADAL